MNSHPFKSALTLVALLSFALVACGDDDKASNNNQSQSCTLKDDPSGPGQYADSCVNREWIATYAGTYTSADCELMIHTTGDNPADFMLTVNSGALAGTYDNAWEGGTGMGNDSYYRFTTDATFTTTKSLNFAAGEKVSDNEQTSIRLSVSNVDTTPTYTAGYSRTVISPLTNDEVDCGTMTKK